MKVLVIGSGGREHALVWKLSQSQRVRKLFVAPGNAGMARLAECVSIPPDDLQGLLQFAQREKIDLTVVGPEGPLCDGIVSLFEEAGLPIFGPSQKAAQLEGSKIFTKDFLARHHIPTAAYTVVSDYERACQAVKSWKQEILVVKADGLAAGKGVFVCSSKEEALNALHFLFIQKGLGGAAARVVLEETLIGTETSFMVLAKGTKAVPLATSKDHKRVYEGDLGPNTGGMGTISPSPYLDSHLQTRVMQDLIAPTLAGLEKEGMPYQGILYAGLMLTKEGPKLLEYNVRLGDPETQVILPRLKNDLVDCLEAVMIGNCPTRLDWSEDAAVCVVMAAKGYPGVYQKGQVISGLEEASKDALIFHAGTRLSGTQVVTDGGRVLGVTGLGSNFEAARQKAYGAVQKISWDGAFYRKDI